MGKDSAISWTDHTFNPWWGCVKVSEACRNCYAESLDKRVSGKLKAHWGPTAPRRFFPDAHWNEPLEWNADAEAAGKRARVFCGSMCDWAEDRPELIPHRLRLFQLIRATPWLDWLLLTKRHERLSIVLPWYDGAGRQLANPWPNVWVGCTAEDQANVLARGYELRRIDAAVRFLSMEPLLELIGEDVLDAILGPDLRGEGLGQIHWAIVGDESGANARPGNVHHVRQVRDACTRHHVAFHFKQWAGKLIPDGIVDPFADDEDGRKGRKIHLPVLYDLEPEDGRQWAEYPR